MRFEREELFWHYQENTNPFFIITVSIDITNVVRYCKEHKNFYATMGYLITKSVNKIDAFRWRYEDNQFHFYNQVFPNFTQKINDNKIGYFDCPYHENYELFIEGFQKIQMKFYQSQESSLLGEKGSIWLSCLPWVSFQSFVPLFDKNNTTPQFIWDQYQEKDDRYTINLMILAHHGFVDGFHISKFLEILNLEILNFQKIERL